MICTAHIEYRCQQSNILCMCHGHLNLCNKKETARTVSTLKVCMIISVKQWHTLTWITTVSDAFFTPLYNILLRHLINVIWLQYFDPVFYIAHGLCMYTVYNDKLQLNWESMQVNFIWVFQHWFTTQNQTVYASTNKTD